MAEKTGANSGRFQKGQDSRRGVGKKGRSGRKPNTFMHECEDIADTLVLPKIRQYLSPDDELAATPNDAGFRWAAEFVASYTKSKAPTKSEHSGAVALEIVRRSEL